MMIAYAHLRGCLRVLKRLLTWSYVCAPVYVCICLCMLCMCVCVQIVLDTRNISWYVEFERLDHRDRAVNLLNGFIYQSICKLKCSFVTCRTLSSIPAADVTVLSCRAGMREEGAYHYGLLLLLVVIIIVIIIIVISYHYLFNVKYVLFAPFQCCNLLLDPSDFFIVLTCFWS